MPPQHYVHLHPVGRLGFNHPFGTDRPRDHPDTRGDAGWGQGSPGTQDSGLRLKPVEKQELWLLAISFHSFSSRTKAEERAKTAASLGTGRKSLILPGENHASIETGGF